MANSPSTKRRDQNGNPLPGEYDNSTGKPMGASDPNGAIQRSQRWEDIGARQSAQAEQVGATFGNFPRPTARAASLNNRQAQAVNAAAPGGIPLGTIQQAATQGQQAATQGQQVAAATSDEQAQRAAMGKPFNVPGQGSMAVMPSASGNKLVGVTNSLEGSMDKVTNGQWSKWGKAERNQWLRSRGPVAPQGEVISRGSPTMTREGLTEYDTTFGRRAIFEPTAETRRQAQLNQEATRNRKPMGTAPGVYEEGANETGKLVSAPRVAPAKTAFPARGAGTTATPPPALLSAGQKAIPDTLSQALMGQGDALPPLSFPQPAVPAPVASATPTAFPRSKASERFAAQTMVPNSPLKRPAAPPAVATTAKTAAPRPAPRTGAPPAAPGKQPILLDRMVNNVVDVFSNMRKSPAELRFDERMAKSKKANAGARLASTNPVRNIVPRVASTPMSVFSRNKDLAASY